RGWRRDVESLLVDVRLNQGRRQVANRLARGDPLAQLRGRDLDGWHAHHLYARRRRRHAGGQAAHVRRYGARAVHHAEAGELEYFVQRVPARQLGQDVGADQEEQLPTRSGELAEQLDRVRGRGTIQVQPRQLEARVAFDGEAHHFAAVRAIAGWLG